MVKITLHLPPQLHRALWEAERTEKRPQAEVLGRAPEEHLGQRERPLPHSVGVGEDRDLSGADSEDRLRAGWGRD